jgi:hypothetical protein
VSPNNFDAIHFISFSFQNSIVAVLGVMIFIADLTIYAATPPV